MTSDIGSDHLLELADGESSEAAREPVMAEVQAMFRPEFLNRIDSIILFRRLDRSDMTYLVDLQLARLANRLADRHIILDVTESAKHWLADAGYDPKYGARPLKRVIQNRVQNPLAEAILAGRFTDGDTVVVDHASANGDELQFSTTAEHQQTA